MEKRMYHFFSEDGACMHMCVCRDFVSSLKDVFEESGIMIDASL